MPSAERERLGLIRMVTNELKSWSEEADSVLEDQDIEGRVLRGFRSGRKTLWIDPHTEELVRVDLPLGGTRMIMTNFRLDPDDLDESHFVTEPPPGYTATVRGPISSDVSNAGEQDLVEFLMFMANLRTDGHFPDAINPLEVLTLQDRGLLREDIEATPAEEEDGARRFAEACQRAVTFVMGMGPDRDWQYAGADTPLGSSDTPIAWWRTDEGTYRVIWGDLTLTTESTWDHAVR